MGEVEIKEKKEKGRERRKKKNVLNEVFMFWEVGRKKYK